MMENLWRFARMDIFLRHFQPKTPYGKQEKKEKKLHTDRESLEREFDRIEMFLEFIEKHKPEADRLEYHLSRIPELSVSISSAELHSEIYNTKKFLHNYASIISIAGKEIAGEFSLEYDPAGLLNLLGYDKDQEESFFIGERYSPELKYVREELRKINGKIDELKESRLEEIREKCGLDFRFQDFLVADETSISGLPDDLINIESYDNRSVRIKPRYSQSFYQVHNSAASLLDREKELEKVILISLAEEIEKDRSSIDKIVQGIKSLDVTLARARLARQFDCVRPEIAPLEPMVIKVLRFVPLEEDCREKNVEYTSLSAEFDCSNIVISGSNMGGKTVVLSTILFAQLLVQQGFFVPATGFRTDLYDKINLIGDSRGEGGSGLSSYGEEIMSLIRSSGNGRILYLVDEFARTTNSLESYALNCALLESFSRSSGLRSFSSTHQDRLPDFKNTSYWAMRGLDHGKYGKYFHSDYNGDLDERISLINSFMDYSLAPRNSGTAGRDALKIADILGLDGKLIALAEKYIKKQEK